MSRLNWQRVAAQQQRDRATKQYNRGQAEKRLERIWLLGKHYGKHMHELPLEYLIWASETFKDDDYHRLKADAELLKRYHLLAHKVGGPANNTTVEKPSTKNLDTQHIDGLITNRRPR